ncbi:MAG: hypothetical protein KDN05_22075 [Verrucomicrobiae bacterium]|nr:hypothetical protein [Verrucomicrobiae bacterium]
MDLPPSVRSCSALAVAAAAALVIWKPWDRPEEVAAREAAPLANTRLDTPRSELARPTGVEKQTRDPGPVRRPPDPPGLAPVDPERILVLPAPR